jgi:hypothetical protein
MDFSDLCDRFRSRGTHGQWPVRFRAGDGSPAVACFSPLCGAVTASTRPNASPASTSFAVSPWRNGLGATDFARKPARHRSVSAGAIFQAVSSGLSKSTHRPQHNGQRQRRARLDHVHDFGLKIQNHRDRFQVFRAGCGRKKSWCILPSPMKMNDGMAPRRSSSV